MVMTGAPAACRPCREEMSDGRQLMTRKARAKFQ
jgi:hypothetical protein